MCTLADTGRRTMIDQQDIEDLLTVELGISQEETMRKHVGLMIRLGYLKVMRRGLGKEGMSYDLIGKKVDEAKRELTGQLQPEPKKGGKPRR